MQVLGASAGPAAASIAAKSPFSRIPSASPSGVSTISSTSPEWPPWLIVAPPRNSLPWSVWLDGRIRISLTLVVHLSAARDPGLRNQPRHESVGDISAYRLRRSIRRNLEDVESTVRSFGYEAVTACHFDNLHTADWFRESTRTVIGVQKRYRDKIRIAIGPLDAKDCPELHVGSRWRSNRNRRRWSLTIL